MKKSLITTFCILFTFYLTAQKRLDGSIAIGADFTKGNFMAFDVYANTELKQDSTMYSWDILPSFRYSQRSQNGTTHLDMYEREFYNIGTMTRRFGKWKLMAFSEMENSFMRNIAFRGSLGLGVGYEVVSKDGFRVTLSEALIPETYNSSLATGRRNLSVRASTRLKMTYESSTVKISSITLFQPAIFSTPAIDFDENINIRSTNTFSYNFTKYLSLGLSYVLIYQSYAHYLNPKVVALSQTSSFFIKYSFANHKRKGDGHKPDAKTAAPAKTK